MFIKIRYQQTFLSKSYMNGIKKPINNFFNNKKLENQKNKKIIINHNNNKFKMVYYQR